MTDMTKKESSSKPSKTGAKKPYQSPAFRSEKVFEVSALSCGKVNGTQAQCRVNRKVS
jgi:hypothetical protein